MINAGDGKHEHPSQALLDVSRADRADRLARRASRSGSSATSLHSRVARSCLRAFQLMGAEVTVAGPPTLIPRGIEELGCEVAYTLDDLGSADVVYALRMQHERMAEAFVPSLREYAIELPDQLPPARPAPAADASRPGQPRRRALARGDRRAQLADHRPGRRAVCSCGWRSSTRSSPAQTGRARPRPGAAGPSPIGEPA